MDSDEPEEPIREKPRFGLISLALAALVIFITMSVFVWDKLKQDVWVYYTDDAGTRVGIEEKSSFASASANATYWEWRDKNEQYMLSITTPMTALMLQGLHKEMDETFQASGKEPVEFGNPPWAHKL